MDWQRITNAVKTAQMGDGTIDERFLDTLDKDSPDISAEVRRIINRSQVANAFMMTAVGDFLPISDALFSADDIIGPWKIESLLGTGGMGEVYKARRADGLYDQTVAIKVMKGQSESRKERFNSERQRLASLNHPNIAKIFDGGLTANDYPYMVMDYIEGLSLFNYVTSHKLTRTARLDLFRTICRAVSHAHSQLIIHRDIKSDNVLVDADAQVKLVDFGIATLIGEEDETKHGSFSLSSAAPEQLNNGALSVQTDIFALGLLLHQLLTDELPERRANGGVSIRISDLPKDLEAILETCLKHDPADRYQAAAALEKDVEAFQAHLPVSARQGSQFYKLGKLLKRAPIASTLAAGFVAALIIGLSTSQYYSKKATAEAQKAADELVIAEWNFQKADILGSVANSYVDAFQYAFGQDNNADLLTQRLLEYLAISQKEDRVDSPLSAAQKSYAVGRHFLSRNDYVNARAALEPWVTEGYGGSEQLLRFGQANLAHAYRNLGKPDLAAELFKSVELFYRNSPEKNSYEHMAMAVSAALLSEDEDLTNGARMITNTLLEAEDGPQMKMYMYSQMARMESKIGNWEGAYEALTSTVSIIESGTIGASSGSDTEQINLAQMDVFHKQDLVSARKRIEAVKDVAKTHKGESKTLGVAYELEAVIYWIEGDYDTAQTLIEKGNILTKKYTGLSDSYAHGLLFQVVIKADAGKFDEAHKVLSHLGEIPTSDSATWLAVAKLYVEARENGMGAAQIFYNSQGLELSKIRLNLRQNYLLSILEKDGLKI